MSKTSVTGPFTGKTYTIYWHEEVGCWTYRDERGRGPGISYLTEQHATPERAAETAMARDVWIAALAENQPLEREAYEAEARRLGVPVYPDEDLSYGGKASYGVRYGQELFVDPPAQNAKYALARRRLWALDAAAERQRQAAASVPPPVLAPRPWGAGGVRYDEACAICGRVTEIDNDTDACRAHGAAG